MTPTSTPTPPTPTSSRAGGSCPPSRGDRCRQLVMVVVVAAGVAALHRLGQGALRPPPATTSVEDLSAWVESRGAVPAAFALLRLAGMVAGTYVLAVVLARSLARASNVGSLVAVVDALTMPALRRVLAGAGAASVSVIVVVGMPTAAGAQTAPPTMRAGNPTTSTVPSPSPPATMRAEPAAAPALPAAPVPPAETITEPADTWVVEPGDSFWSISARRLADHLGRRPTDAEVVPAWRALIEANRQHLPRPDDDDLLFSGIELQLPAL